LNFFHSIDLSLPSQIKACASSQHLKDAVAIVQKAGSAQQQFLIVKLVEIMLTGMQTSVDFSKNCLNENVALTSFIGDGKDLKDQTNLD
jgi:type VI secretion system secreted protein Hcp